MPKDRFITGKNRDRVRDAAPPDWEADLRHTYVVRADSEIIALCFLCKQALEPGETVDVYRAHDNRIHFEHREIERCSFLQRFPKLARRQQEMSYTDITPESLKGWKHDDVIFIMRMAGLCGWRAVQEPQGSVRIYATDQTMMRVPNNTGLRMDVFRSWLAKVWRHAEGQPEDVEIADLLDELKLDPSHRGLVWRVVEMNPPVREVPPVPAEPVTPVTTVTHKEPKMAKRITHVRPHIMTDKTVSRTALDRVWSDGSVDFKCAWPECTYTADTIYKIGPHFIHHEKEAEREQIKRATAIALESIKRGDVPNFVSSAVRKEAEASVALDGETQSAPQVITDLNGFAAELSRRIEQFIDEQVGSVAQRLEDAERRAAKAEGDLDALRDLLGVRKD